MPGAFTRSFPRDSPDAVYSKVTELHVTADINISF